MPPEPLPRAKHVSSRLAPTPGSYKTPNRNFPFRHRLPEGTGARHHVTYDMGSTGDRNPTTAGRWKRRAELHPGHLPAGTRRKRTAPRAQPRHPNRHCPGLRDEQRNWRTSPIFRRGSRAHRGPKLGRRGLHLPRSHGRGARATGSCCRYPRTFRSGCRPSRSWQRSCSSPACSTWARPVRPACSICRVVLPARRPSTTSR